MEANCGSKDLVVDGLVKSILLTSQNLFRHCLPKKMEG